MANSFVRYTGNNSTTSYAIPFSYREAGDLTVTLAGVATTAYTLNAAGTTLTFNSAPANSVAIEIRRKTSQTTRLTDYADGSVLTENDLDTDSTQAFFMGQEAIDDANDVIKPSNTNFQWDATSKRIINVTDPVDNQDVATKNWISNTYLTSANLTAITTVNSNIAAISAVNTNQTNINSVNSNSTNINTVATNMPSVTAVANDITKVVAVANDLAEAVSEVETVADDLNEATSEIDTVANAIVNVNAVGNSIANVNTVAGLNTEIAALYAIRTDISGVNAISADVTTVKNNSTNITTLAGITNLTNLANAHAAVSNVSTNLAAVQNFADVYRISSSAPTTSLTVGDLYFDTTANELKVYKSSGWAAAGSTVNGTSQRYVYTISGTPTTITGADDNGNTLAYDAGYADVYVNGVRMSGADITITSGTSVVFASALAAADVVDVVAYGTFNVAAINASNINSGTLNIARLADDSITNAKLDNNSITINGSAVELGGSVTVGETKPTITSTSLIIAPNSATSVTITGTNFASSSTVLPIVEAVTSGGVLTRASVVSWASSTSISATFTLAQGDYRIRVENPDGNAAISTNAILQATPAPTWTTSAGNISTIAGGASIGTLSVVATSDSAVTYAKTSGTLPNGITIGSNGVFAGTESGSTQTTVYSFDVTATDAESQTAVRTFTITISHGATGGGQFN